MPIFIFSILVFLAQLILVFILSRLTINNFFHFFRLFIKNEKTVFLLISLFFIPGTIIHEFSHLFVAMILLLKVRDVRIFPEREETYIKLGRVLYEKKDILRSILVGIAPVFGGLFFFSILSVFKLFPQSNIVIDLFLIYLIYAVSSSMFSSKQDLIDVLYILPVPIIAVIVIYIFNIRLDILFQNETVLEKIFLFMNQLNSYLFLSLLINIILIGTFKGIVAVKNRFAK